MAKKIYPADRLEGVTLEDGWYVESIKPTEKGSGKYSTCYIVSKNGKKGFLKAFDYRDLSKSGRKVTFNKLNGRFEREKKLIKKCKDYNIYNVVEYITSGQYYFEESDINELVDYFILEHSDDGDISECINNDDLIHLVLKFESLADVFDGLFNLHIKGIMHLDIKPTNLLYFINERLTKITDFGSARQWVGSEIDEDSKDDIDLIYTTRTFAPPEFLYDEPWSDWNLYRRKVDLYLVGNLIVNFFTDLSFTALLSEEITMDDHWREKKNRGRLKLILPHLVSASTEVLLTIKEKIKEVNESCSNPLDKRDIEQLVEMIKYLCHPDPIERGDPKELKRKNNRDGLDRFRDRFINLAKKAEYKHNTLYKITK